MYIYIYTHTNIYICLHIYMYMHICIYFYILLYTYIQMCPKPSQKCQTDPLFWKERLITLQKVFCFCRFN